MEQTRNKEDPESIKMRSPLRVIFLNHSVRDGGSGRSLFYLIKYIGKTKIIPFVLVPREDVFTELLKKEGLGDRIIVDEKFPENMLIPRLNSNLIPLRVLKIVSVLLNLIDAFIFLLKSPFIINRTKSDIVYCNGTLSKIIGTLVGTLNHRPVIWHVRNIQQTRTLRFTMNFLSLFPAVKKIICVSHAAAQQFYFVGDKISVIYNGVDIDEFNPKRIIGALRVEYGIPEGTIVVGSTGRIVPRKGYEYMVKAAFTVKNKLGENEANKIRFVVIGDTPHYFRDNHMQSLMNLIKELGLEGIFIFTGYKEDVRPYLKDFDIFVIPSNFPDSFPRAVIEAMSLGIPVVGYRIGGITESVEDRVTGLLNEPGNIELMGDSILKLINDKALRLSMGSAGKERIKKYFSVERKTREIEEKILGAL
jgi:glycosyltransferase involved in cell wall biosynthesis